MPSRNTLKCPKTCILSTKICQSSFYIDYCFKEYPEVRLLQCESSKRNMSLQKCHKHMKSKKSPLNLMEEELLFQPISLLYI